LVENKAFRPIVGGFVVLLLFLLVSGMVALGSARAIRADSAEVRRTFLINEASARLRANVRAAQDDAKGFFLTGDPQYLALMDEERQAVFEALDQLHQLVRDPEQVARLAELSDVAQEKSAFTARLIELRQAGGLEMAAELMLLGDERSLTFRFERLAEAFDEREHALLAERLARAERSERRATQVAVATVVVGAALLAGVLWSALGLLRARERSRQAEVRHTEELEQKVEARTFELRALTEELESFSYSVSHDLRAPLRAIGGNVQMLREDFGENLGPEELRLLDNILANSGKMSRLIDDLLMLSRASRGEMRIAEVDLSQEAERIVDEIRSRHQDPFEAQVEPGVKARGDVRLLAILLENLLRNAQKFSRKSANPRVEFGAGETPFGKGYYVRDNGVGFDDGMFEKALQPFARLHTEQEFEGTGIGLAICRRVVERHGGQIWAESRAGEGATIWFTLE
jgi:signal transduction histidine kinase